MIRLSRSKNTIVGFYIFILLGSIIPQAFAQDDEPVNLEILEQIEGGIEIRKSDLIAAVGAACPVRWEDLTVEILPNPDDPDVWEGDAADRDIFVAQITAVTDNAVAGDIETLSNDVAFVTNECIAKRAQLLNAMITTLPNEVVAAVTQINKDQIVVNDGFLVGDIRMTGRAEEAPGWLFLAGQTIGSSNSLADLKGLQYRKLYNLAKTWAPNVGDEEWDSDVVVTLPDARGKSLVALDNQGGGDGNVIASAVANKVGGTMGVEQKSLTSQQLPTHNHTMPTNGAHRHKHNYYIVYYDTNGGWRKLNGSGDNMKTSGGPTYTNTDGKHKHTIYNAGGSAPVSRMQPRLFVRVEMKYSE